MTEQIDLKYKDFVKICRLCCNESTNLIPIFRPIEDVSNNFWNDAKPSTSADADSVQEAFLLKIGLNISRNDGLPENLCADCNEKLMGSYQFQEQCISSEVYLQDILVKHKECTRLRNESEDDDRDEFDDNFAVDCTDRDDENSADADLFRNGKVEALEITVQVENDPEMVSPPKRKRGRPRTRLLEEPPPVKVDRRKLRKKNEMKKPQKKDICLICGKVVNHNIKGHQAIHDKSETYTCDICGFQTNVKMYLGNHMQKTHVAQREYPCPHCHLVFRHSVSLKRHATIHTGEKNFVCEECGKSYRQREMLIAHRKRHLPPTIQCSFCDKLFYSKNELKSHVGLHTGIKAFKCDICSAAFVASSSLAAHRRQHWKENVLPSCKLCGVSFTDRVVFNMHMKDHNRASQSIAYNSRK